MINLEGKTFAVTGGASGIGRSTVATLCEAGATVFFGDINEDGGAETAAASREAALKGMAEMSKLYEDMGRELYLGAGGREHD